ncbi:hypothetical protein BDZ91DRAFT_803033 [Kalaharituber pfeilii]|nr:hypothetical protein BDZ91DRAFT_803033 [Kalaharituber pfeilii]
MTLMRGGRRDNRPHMGKVSSVETEMARGDEESRPPPKYEGRLQALKRQHIRCICWAEGDFKKTPPPQTPGSSPVTRLETPLADTPPAPPHPIPARTKKRKGKTPAPNQPYEIKRQPSDEEAKKIASTGVPPMQTSPPPSPRPAPPSPPPPKPSTTRKGKGKLASQEEAFKRHMATTKKGPSPRPGNTATSPPTTPDATTKGKTGIVIHGIALRKDLGKVRQWLEAANKELGKISGIRWLRKRTTLVEEGKKTSSAVVYLEKETDVGRVRLGGRWLRSVRYESERGRK